MQYPAAEPVSLLRVFLLHILILIQIRTSSASIQNNGTAYTARYWDCCKPSCGWKGKASFMSPVRSCDKNNKPLDSFDGGTGCNGGDSYACADHTSWAVNDTFAYGFAGAYLLGGQEKNWCCTCFQLTFRDEALSGKTFMIQVTNTDYDVITDNVFTFALPGGNNSNTAGCPVQYDTSPNVFGDGSFGISSATACDAFPTILQPGCRFRFEWLQNVERPQVNYQRITCPKELTDRSGCVRTDDITFATANPNWAPSAQPQSIRTLVGLAVVSLLTARYYS